MLIEILLAVTRSKFQEWFKNKALEYLIRINQRAQAFTKLRH